MKYLCRLMEIFVLSYFINENRNNFYMKTKLCIYSQPNSSQASSEKSLCNVIPQQVHELNAARFPFEF